jgi:hypothetical protein
VVKVASSVIRYLVQEWTRKWLAGTCGDAEAEAEVWLRDILKEVI